MQLSLLEFYTGWWNKDVPQLLQKADILFQKAGKEKWASAAEKIIEARGWEPSRRLITPNLKPVLEQLGIFYFSKFMLPGPCFIFPLRDLGSESVCRAQVKPCYELMDTNNDKLCKYVYIGPKTFLGPNWIGNDKETIAQIIKQKRVVLVEGGFDLLACRLMCPEFPFLSPLKKDLSAAHEIYLRMLGVETIYLMFDNEAAKEGRSEGAGNSAMEWTRKSIKSMKTEVILCPAEDASKCLESSRKARELRSTLVTSLS